MASIKLKGDTSGELTIQAPSVAGTNTLNLQASSGTLATTAQASIGMKNRIINGDMRIHQRGGTITAASATVYYGLDRFWGYAGTGQFSMEQSTDAPDNFLNSMKVTVTTVDSSMAAGDRYMLSQPIEGLNVTNLDFGLSTAQTVTLSFWVKSSITGTFGAVLINSNATRTYVKEYTINAANTWEKKTITIAGDTTGTWTYTNALWGSVRFCLATGSTYHGTDSTWNAGNYISTSNQTNLMATSGATFYITGVQLEVGNTATPFEHLQYTTQLQLCQRYYQFITGAGSSYAFFATGTYISSTNCRGFLTSPKVNFRAIPTITFQGAASDYRILSSATKTVSSISGVMPDKDGVIYFSADTTASTIGNSGYLSSNASSATAINFSAEL